MAARPVIISANEDEHSYGEKDMEELFIEMVQERPGLYNKQHKDYKNQRKAIQQWLQIAEIFGLVGTAAEKLKEIKEKWRKLRDRFVKELKKFKDVRSGSAPIGGSSFQYFEVMKFLEPHIRARKSHTNLPQCSKSADVSGSQTNEFDLSEEERDINNEEIEAVMGEMVEVHHEVSIQSFDVDEPQSEPEEPCNSAVSRSRNISSCSSSTPSCSSSANCSRDPSPVVSRKGKKPVQKRRNESVDETDEEIKKLISTVSGSLESSDTYDGIQMYCLSLADTLRSLTERQLGLAKARIQSLLYEIQFPTNEG